MPAVSSCLTAEELRRLVAQGSPDDDVERLAQHVESCETCGVLLDECLAADPTVAALGQETRHDLPREQDLQALRDRLLSLRHPDSELPADAATETAGRPAPVAEATQVVAAGSPADEGGVRGGSAADRARSGLDFLAPPQQPDEIGRLANYRILKTLGTGGMGVVFLAEDVLLQRKVAIKTMLPALAANPTAKGRFLREARAAAAVEHEHVIAIHQVGEEGGVPYLAMPLLRGEALSDRLQRVGRLPADEALRIAAEMADGLTAAHARGLIHRDVKPANVWLEGEHSKVKLLDFGLARAQVDDVQLTQVGTILGTPAFMAPEQSRGEAVDGRADLFSLGAVLYTMLTGQRPFRGENTAQVLTALSLFDPPAPAAVVPEIPEALSGLAMRLLSKSPDGRPATAAETASELRALRAAARERPAPARVAAPAARSAAPRSASQRRRLPVALALVALGAIGLLYAAATVIHLQMDRGELVLETDDDEVEVTIKQPGRKPVIVVLDKHSKKSVELRAGEGDIEARELPEGLRFKTQKFELERGGKPVFTARMLLADSADSAGVAKAKTPPPLTTAKKASDEQTVKSPSPAAVAKVAPNVGKTKSVQPPVVAKTPPRPDPAALDPNAVPIEEASPDEKLAKIVLLAGKHTGPPGLHEWMAEAAVLRKLLLQTEGVFPVVVDGVWPADRDTLEGARTLVFMLEKESWPPLQAHAPELQKLAAAGIGLVAIHVALDVPEDFRPRAWDLFGAYYQDGVSAGRGGGNRRVNFEGLSDHPAARGVGAADVDDGWLFRLKFAPDLPGVMSLLRVGKEHLGGAPAGPLDDAVAWTFDRPDGGRSVGFTGGCHHSSFKYESYRRILVNAILWSAGVDVPESGAKVDLEPADLTREWRTVPAARLSSAPAKPYVEAPEFTAWKDATMALPIEEQMAAVGRKLQDLNPGFDGQFHRQIENGSVTFVSLPTQRIVDISPLRVLPRLPMLHLTAGGNGSLVDLAPLTGLKLTRLRLDGNPIYNLSPLVGMPLVELTIGQTKVVDLSPLKGMPLDKLECPETGVRDFSPLRETPIRELWFWVRNPVGSAAIYETLLDNKTLTTINKLPADEFRAIIPAIAHLETVITKLREANPGYDGSVERKTANGQITELQIHAPELKDISALAELKSLTSLDLSPAGPGRLEDLGPLAGLELKSLNLQGQPVSDLAVLKGMPLKRLQLANTRVKDLEPLRGSPLEHLELHGNLVCPDLTPVAEAPLKELHCNLAAAAHVERLRDVKTLERINGKPIEEFWKDWPAQEEVFAVAAKLQELNPKFNGAIQSTVERGVVVELRVETSAVENLSPLQALGGLQRLYCSAQSGGCMLSDLTPLKGLKLTQLEIAHTQVRDLTPLAEMPLTVLHIYSTPVKDITPLKGLPIKDLLYELKSASDVEVIRTLESLERLNGRPVEDAVKEFEAKAKKSP